jgi:hypothetical protein
MKNVTREMIEAVAALAEESKVNVIGLDKLLSKRFPRKPWKAALDAYMHERSRPECSDEQFWGAIADEVIIAHEACEDDKRETVNVIVEGNVLVFEGKLRLVTIMAGDVEAHDLVVPGVDASVLEPETYYTLQLRFMRNED